MDKLIYLDNAATTSVSPEVLEAMLPFYREDFFNPSSFYAAAHTSKHAVEDARAVIAGTLGAEPREIYFTSCGTESDNWALKATVEAYANKGNHVIVSAIEHHAIIETAAWLERQGVEVTYLSVDEFGLVDPATLEAAIRPETVLVSIMFANNEIGTIEPVKELAAIAHQHGALFHTDAVQAYTHIPIDVNELGIDLLSGSAHKFHGPKGVGFLYQRKTVKNKSFIHGGEQERGRRAGTENVAGIVGMAKAAEMAFADLEERATAETAVRDHAIERILAEIPYVKLNGDRVERLPNNVNFSFHFIEGESMLFKLAAFGICASSGSACASGSLDPSHVLIATGVSHGLANGTLRLTLSEETSIADIDFTIDRLKEIVGYLRQLSPLWEDFVKKHPEADYLSTCPTR
jgi:cysteine desulfurase